MSLKFIKQPVRIDDKDTKPFYLIQNAECPGVAIGSIAFRQARNAYVLRAADGMEFDYADAYSIAIFMADLADV